MSTVTTSDMEEHEARAWMRANMDDCTDPTTGIANLTQLAEGAALAAGREGWLDDEWSPVWEWADEEAENAGRGDHP